jgi:hypothetical protein
MLHQGDPQTDQTGCSARTGKQKIDAEGWNTLQIALQVNDLGANFPPTGVAPPRGAEPNRARPPKRARRGRSMRLQMNHG